MRLTDVITRYPSSVVFLLLLLASLAAGLIGIVFLVGAFRAVRPGVPRKDVLRALSWVRRSPLIEPVFAARSHLVPPTTRTSARFGTRVRLHRTAALLNSRVAAI
jgi:hypothetical protein